MKSRLATWALGLIVVLAWSSCARITTVSTPEELRYLRIAPDSYDRVAYVKGYSCVGQYVLFFRFSSPLIFEAMTMAMNQAPEANFLLNRHVFLRKEAVVPIVYHRLCLYIEGEAVRLKASHGDQQ